MNWVEQRPWIYGMGIEKRYNWTTSLQGVYAEMTCHFGRQLFLYEVISFILIQGVQDQNYLKEIDITKKLCISDP